MHVGEARHLGPRDRATRLRISACPALGGALRLVCVRAAGEMGAGPARRAAPRTIYEATEEGVDHFETWMLGSSPTPPLRDELHMKIALCSPRNVPRLIDMVYGQELACMGRLRDLKELSEQEDAIDPREW